MKKYWLLLIVNFICLNLFAQDEQNTSFRISGQITTDGAYNFNQVNPDWYDVMRPTQLPAYNNQYGADGNSYFSARQSMLDFRSFTPTKYGELSTRVTFDLLGVANDAGRTTFHMLYAYAELGMLGFGHTWSLFCDFDGYPNTIEYWGPSGMSLCKNAQFRFIPLNDANRFAIAVERPGASADQGIYRERIALADVKPKFQLPDLSAEFRMTRKWGYAELAGIVRKIGWVDQGNEPYDYSGTAVGWGFNLSSNIKLGKKSMFLGQVIIGEGIENYMNDAPTDIGIKNDFSNPNAPLKGVALPVHSYSTYINHKWNKESSSIIGYSCIFIDNTDGQSPDAFHIGRYASTNLLYYPLPDFTVGAEFQWINRENFTDGWTTSASKIQISCRYFFKQELENK